MSHHEVHYSDYLQLDKILHAQEMESARRGAPAHDEMLFIVIHQSYELWFRQILFELESIARIMSGRVINDNSPDLQTIVHRLGRIATILRVAVHQVDILETMTPLDFLDFRDFLRPASGFQSWQFKVLEARLGLTYDARHGKAYYLSQLRDEERQYILEAEAQPSLLQLVNTWLERMPFFEHAENWAQYRSVYPPIPGRHPFWSDYAQLYADSLVEGEKANRSTFEQVFFPEGGERQLQFSAPACRAALFIALYRAYPLLQLPFQLLNNLLEIDEQLSTWRYRHLSMVTRMIGTRIGTGGSTGRDYLQGALLRHYIFRDLAALSSYLIDRRRLPRLSPVLERKLGF